MESIFDSLLTESEDEDEKKEGSTSLTEDEIKALVEKMEESERKTVTDAMALIKKYVEKKDEDKKEDETEDKKEDETEDKKEEKKA
jgi:hypothetical protein